MYSHGVLSSYRVLGEREMLWEHELSHVGKCFYSFFKFSQTFMSASNEQLDYS